MQRPFCTRVDRGQKGQLTFLTFQTQLTWKMGTPWLLSKSWGSEPVSTYKASGDLESKTSSWKVINYPRNRICQHKHTVLPRCWPAILVFLQQPFVVHSGFCTALCTKAFTDWDKAQLYRFRQLTCITFHSLSHVLKLLTRRWSAPLSAVCSNGLLTVPAD